MVWNDHKKKFTSVSTELYFVDISIFVFSSQPVQYKNPSHRKSYKVTKYRLKLKAETSVEEIWLTMILEFDEGTQALTRSNGFHRALL